MRRGKTKILIFLLSIFSLLSILSVNPFASFGNNITEKEIREKVAQVKELAKIRKLEGRDIDGIIKATKDVDKLIEQGKLQEVDGILSAIIKRLKGMEELESPRDRINKKLQKSIVLEAKLNNAGFGIDVGSKIAKAMDLFSKMKYQEPEKILDDVISQMEDLTYKKRITANLTAKVSEKIDHLQKQFMEILVKNTPSYDAEEAVQFWFKAKNAYQANYFEESIDLLQKAIDSMKKAKPIPIAKILSDQTTIAPKPVPASGKVIPPDKRGIYVGYWGFPMIGGKNSFNFRTQTHVALLYDDIPWYNWNGRFLSWDDWFSFDESFFVSPISKENKRLVLTIKQLADFYAEYGAVLAFTWTAGYGFADSYLEYAKAYLQDYEKGIKIQDVITGRWDEYIKKFAHQIKQYGKPIMIELLNEFDGTTVNNSASMVFGKEGNTPVYKMLTPEILRKYDDKLSFADLKTNFPELFNNYGDSSIPDGPERVRDMWKHVHDIFDEYEVSNVTWFQHTATAHGYPRSFLGEVWNEMDYYWLTNAPWNKMSYYWPGKNYIDWIGSSVYYNDISKNPLKRDSFHFAFSWFYKQLEESSWKDTPILLLEFAYKKNENKKNVIKKVFGDYINNDFPGIAGFFYLEDPLPLGHYSEETKAWEKYVKDNPRYVQYIQTSNDHTPPGRIDDLRAITKGKTIVLQWTAKGDDSEEGTADYYVIKYRTDPIEKNEFGTIDFRKEPWRLWSKYETKDIKGEPKPQKAGSKEKMVIPEFKPGKYYFAIQSVDDVPYNSKISNIAEVSLGAK